MARIRAQEAKMAAEAAAKLGVPPSSTAPTTEASGSERSEETSEALHHDKKKSKKAKGGSSKRKQGEVEEPAPDAPAVKRIVIEPRGNGAPEAAVEFKPTPREGWWGARTFVSAGSMGDIDKEARVGKKARAAFDEDEQARIYTAAQAGKTQGKVGLGQATGTVKVGGVKWSGKKVTFEVEAVDGGGTSGNVDEEDREGASEASGLKAVESSNKLDNLAEGATATGLERVKWKKLIGEVLAGAPGKEMKVKGVRKEVHARVVQKLGRKVDKSDVAAAVDSVVAESSKFVLTGKVVRLKK